MAPRRRLTVALVLAGDVAQEIDGMRRALGAAALRRIPPHLTLVPPVNVRLTEVDDAVRVVRRAAFASGPIRLELGPPETFWPVTPVVYLTVGGGVEDVRELRARLLDGPLATPEGRRDEREYVPHVTLDQNIEPVRIPAALETLSSYRASVTLGEVTILEFDEENRRWNPMAFLPLGRPRIVGRGGIEVELSVGTRLEPEADAWQSREWAAYSGGAYGSGINTEEEFAITARVGGEIVGTATGQLRSLGQPIALCRLGNLIVAQERRGEGVGGHLLKAVEDLARERGCERVRLETRAGGEAQGFYAGRGYSVTSTLPEWRFGHDFVVMERRV